MPEKMCKKKHLTSFQLIILGFAGVIPVSYTHLDVYKRQEYLW